MGSQRLSTAGGVKESLICINSKYQVSSQDTRVKRANSYFKSFTFCTHKSPCLYSQTTFEYRKLIMILTDNFVINLGLLVLKKSVRLSSH